MDTILCRLLTETSFLCTSRFPCLRLGATDGETQDDVNEPSCPERFAPGLFVG